MTHMHTALYVRVSTVDQEPENQLLELRRYVAARGWTAVEYVDHGVSGAKDRRPALDQLVADVRAHRVQAVVCWRLDRLGRNLRHLVMLLDDWHSRGIAFITMTEGIDSSTPAGSSLASSARSRNSSGRASKSACALASRGCALKADAWAGNRARSRMTSSRLSRASRPGTLRSGLASRTRWSPVGGP